jgi:hypothetical protein
LVPRGSSHWRSAAGAETRNFDGNRQELQYAHSRHSREIYRLQLQTDMKHFDKQSIRHPIRHRLPRCGAKTPAVRKDMPPYSQHTFTSRECHDTRNLFLAGPLLKKRGERDHTCRFAPFARRQGHAHVGRTPLSYCRYRKCQGKTTAGPADPWPGHGKVEPPAPTVYGVLKPPGNSFAPSSAETLP